MLQLPNLWFLRAGHVLVIKPPLWLHTLLRGPPPSLRMTQQACTGIIENWIYSGNYELISTFTPTQGECTGGSCGAVASCTREGEVPAQHAAHASPIEWRCKHNPAAACGPTTLHPTVTCAAEMDHTNCTGPGVMAECMSAACCRKEGK